MPRHTPRASEHRRPSKPAEPKTEFRQLSEKRATRYTPREQQWMHLTAAREYFSPFACRQ